MISENVIDVMSSGPKSASPADILEYINQRILLLEQLETWSSILLKLYGKFVTIYVSPEFSMDKLFMRCDWRLIKAVLK